MSTLYLSVPFSLFLFLFFSAFIFHILSLKRSYFLLIFFHFFTLTLLLILSLFSSHSFSFFLSFVLIFSPFFSVTSIFSQIRDLEYKTTLSFFQDLQILRKTLYTSISQSGTHCSSHLISETITNRQDSKQHQSQSHSQSQSQNAGNGSYPFGANGSSPLTDTDTLSIGAGVDPGSDIFGTGVGGRRDIIQSNSNSRKINMKDNNSITHNVGDVGISLLHSYDTLVDSCELYLKARSVAICVTEEDIIKQEVITQQEERMRFTEERIYVDMNVTSFQGLLSNEQSVSSRIDNDVTIPYSGNRNGKRNGNGNSYSDVSRNENTIGKAHGLENRIDSAVSSLRSDDAAALILTSSNIQVDSCHLSMPSITVSNSNSDSNSISAGDSNSMSDSTSNLNKRTYGDEETVTGVSKRIRRSDTAQAIAETVLKINTTSIPFSTSIPISTSTLTPLASSFISTASEVNCLTAESVSSSSSINISPHQPICDVISRHINDDSSSSNNILLDKKRCGDELSSQNSLSTSESVDLGSIDPLNERKSYRSEVESVKMEVDVEVEREIVFEENHRIEGDEKENQTDADKAKKKGTEERKETEREKEKEKEREKGRERDRNKYICAVMLRLWRAECRRILPSYVGSSSSSSSINGNSSSSGAAGVGDGYQISGYSVSPRSLQGWESYVTEGAETINR